MAKRGNKLDFCLDLGGDSLKIAYAYTESDGSTAYGKVDTEGDVADVGVPAVALYDEAAKEFLYGDEIDAAGKTSFINVVRIKDLLSLVNEDGARANKDYYENKNEFPKFYFPARRGMQSDFGATVESGSTFTAEGFTPRLVCERYFAHIKKLIYKRLPSICSTRLGITDIEEFNAIEPRISIVYSPNACETYIKELSRIVKDVFGQKPYKSMSTTKALSMYAFTSKILADNSEMLVFDMGEESISVAKTATVGGAVTIEGEDGHNPPLAVGGMDVDEALVGYIEGTISQRETPGTPSYGSEGHLAEEGLQAKQYLLMKDLKQAKVLLSREQAPGDAFADGVPISVRRELCVCRKITRAELTECLGIDDCSGVAETITDYILSEMRQPLNSEVKTIFLSGGIADTYGLRDLIKKRLADNSFGDVKFVTIPSAQNDNNDLYIYTYEASAYAAAVGGAMVAVCGIDVKATLSLSYGTFIYSHSHPPKLLKLFVNRGTPLKDGTNEFWSDSDGHFTRLDAEDDSVDDAFYSTIMTQTDIDAKRYMNTDDSDEKGIKYRDTYPVIDEPGTMARGRAERTIMLKEIVSGTILLKYKGERVTLDGATLLFREGISVDGRGRAKALIENKTQGNISTTVRFYRNGEQSPYKSEYKTIRAADVEIVISGIDAFEVSKG